MRGFFLYRSLNGDQNHALGKFSMFMTSDNHDFGTNNWSRHDIYVHIKNRIEQQKVGVANSMH